jgi:hypothetical protein
MPEKSTIPLAGQRRGCLTSGDDMDYVRRMAGLFDHHGHGTTDERLHPGQDRDGAGEAVIPVISAADAQACVSGYEETISSP